jgi:sugar phosphate isomerase/epimerase
VKLLNIAVDEDGDLASEDQAERERAIENYGRWVPVARELGCTAIRANSGGKQVTDHAKALAACIDSFRKLCDRGKAAGITILMENHGGISSDADTIVKIMEAVRETHGADAIGTLPDFGNWPEGVDRFESLNKIMPFAKAVHAKVSDMDERLRHPKFDLDRCVAIVKESGYDGYLGIEFEGRGEPVEGVRRAIRKLTPLL